MKHRLLVIDHIFHQKTRSSDFFFALLDYEFEIDILYLDPGAKFEGILDSYDHEHILIWQMDFVTPYFIAKERRVIVVPMFDGSGGLSDSHWIYNKQASYINFSLELHLKALSLGCRSLLIKYFPDPSNYSVIEDFNSKRLFFWERRPDSYINCRTVSNLFGDDLDCAHIHLAPDVQSTNRNDVTEFFNCELSTSTWFDSKLDFDRAVNACNIFVAPRLSEGIGLSMLEAMARGMVIIAYDAPTNNEYIKNWSNGILFNENFSRTDLSEWNTIAPKLSAAARKTVEVGHTRWLKQSKNISRFVKLTPCSICPPHPRFGSFVSEVIDDYQTSIETYTRKLNSNLMIVQAMGEWNKLESDRVEFAKLATPQLSGVNFYVGRPSPSQKLVSGWSSPENGHVWAIELVSFLEFSDSKLADHSFFIVLEARALYRKSLIVEISGCEPMEIILEDSFSHYFLDKIVSVEKEKLEIKFSVEVLDFAGPGDHRELAFALRSVRAILS